jgi:hypothetical protein
MSDEHEGPRMDVYTSSSDGTQRDLFDPKLSAKDFANYVAFRGNELVPSQRVEELQRFICEMRHCVAMFNDAFEYEDDEGDDDGGDYKGDEDNGT